jgi:hypothetical protein
MKNITKKFIMFAMIAGVSLLGAYIAIALATLFDIYP